ncbi:YqiA/YcfP family alpha/beta fold hydrolase [Formosa sp. 4Alg 33]|uniref:YqiA/YcfP family alpha/beta fold hydrolase n=1 Tax=Formosa sp. 4Alg 33 TaxID=3382189 RepID=UPI003D9C17F2
MNILYIHGLNSSLNAEKRAVLEHYGTVFAPSIDYENHPDAITQLITTYQTSNMHVVIGSSMGGFVGYYVSNQFQCPALLFNPALAQRSVHQNTPELTPHHKSALKHLVLGTADTKVNPAETLQFLSKTISRNPEYTIHLRNDLEHRIPLDIFKEEVDLFFSKYNQLK